MASGFVLFIPKLFFKPKQQPAREGLCLRLIIVIISSNMPLANCTWLVSDSL